MRNKLSVQQAEEGDEEDGEDDLSAKDKQWGKSKRGYYGADTEEYEVRRHNWSCPFFHTLFSELVQWCCMIIKTQCQRYQALGYQMHELSAPDTYMCIAD